MLHLHVTLNNNLLMLPNIGRIALQASRNVVTGMPSSPC